jgi:FixJ family two-component response regulator
VGTSDTLVVVIEDDAAERKALGRVLRAGGFTTAAYASAEEFRASPPSNAPLCLVLDVRLGGMSGLDLQRTLRAEGSTLPVIVVTAHDDPEIQSEAERLGCRAYLRKPFEGRTLLELLRSWIRTP